MVAQRRASDVEARRCQLVRRKIGIGKGQVWLKQQDGQISKAFASRLRGQLTDCLRMAPWKNLSFSRQGVASLSVEMSFPVPPNPSMGKDAAS